MCLMDNETQTLKQLQIKIVTYFVVLYIFASSFSVGSSYLFVSPSLNK